MKKNLIYLILVFSLFFLTSCGSETSAANNEVQNESELNKNIDRRNENFIIGKVTNISDNIVTIEVAEMIRMEKREKNDEKPENNGIEKNQEGDSPINLTGESKDINISNNTKVIIDGNNGLIDDISIEDIVNITMDNDNVNAEAIEKGMRNRRNNDIEQRNSEPIETT